MSMIDHTLHRLREWPHWALILVLAVVFIGTGLGLRDPWPADEPRFAMMAQRMLDSGQWMFPFRGTEIYPDKPPMFMWMQAFFIHLTGSVRGGFLIPAFLSSLAILFLSHDLMRRVWGSQAALLGVLLLLAVPQFIIVSRSGQIDPVLCFWVFLGFYGLMRFSVVDGSRLWMMIGFLAMGMGVITKGVGFLPLLMVPGILLARYRSWDNAIESRHTGGWLLLGMILFLVPILAWLLPMLSAVDQAGSPVFEGYRDNILMKQTAERYLEPSGHFRPWHYFVVSVIPWFWLPITLLLPWLFPQWRTRFKSLDGRIVIPLSWIVLVILFFSLSPGKRGIYVAPLIPALVFVCAPFLQAILANARVQSLAWWFTLSLSLCLFFIGLILIGESTTSIRNLVARVEVNPGWMLELMGLLGIATCYFLKRTRGALCYLVFFAGVWMVYGLCMYPAFNDVRSGKGLMERVEQSMDAETELALVDWREQLMLQARRPVVDFGFRKDHQEQMAEATDWLRESEHRVALVQKRNLEPCINPFDAMPVGRAHGRDWYLISGKSIKQDCEVIR